MDSSNMAPGQTDKRTTSHDGLDDYIRVSSPGLLIIIGALSLVLVATVVWGFIGRIPVTYTVTGCVFDMMFAPEIGESEHTDASASDSSDGVIVFCFIDSSKYSADQISKIDEKVTIEMPDHSTFQGTIESHTEYPMSRGQAEVLVNNAAWVAETCVTSDYSWGFSIRVDDDISSHLFATPQVTFVMDEVPPISFLTR